MVFIVSGGVGEGKTAFFGRVASLLRRRGAAVAGFRSERVYRGEELVGYDLVGLGSRTRAPWLRKDGAGERIGPYAVVPAGLAAAEATIAGSPPSGLLAVDELGPAELGGRGFWPALSPLLQSESRSFLFVVRTGCLAGFKRLFAGRSLAIFRVGGAWSPADAAREILARVRQG